MLGAVVCAVLLLARCIWCRGDQPKTDTAQRKLFAVTLFGSLPRLDRGSLPSACAWRDAGPLQALTTQVLLPAVRAGYAVTVHGHTWVADEADHCASFSSKIFSKALFVATQGSEFVSAAGSISVAGLQLDDKSAVRRPSDDVLREQNSEAHSVFGVASLERAVALAVKELDAEGAMDAMIVALRWDVVLYSVLDVTALDRGLFYRANWCRASGSRAPTDSGKECYGLQDFYCDSTGVPDFYFAGNTTAMRHVFMGLSDRVWFTSPPDVQNAGCCCMHGVIAGALARAEDRNGVRLGRYLYHQIDFDFVREGTPGGRNHDMSRMTFVRSGGSLWLEGDSKGLSEPPYRVDLPQGPSVCSEKLHLCTWRNDTYGKDVPTGYHIFDGVRGGTKGKRSWWWWWW